MKSSSILLIAGALFSTLAANQVSAASFDARTQGGVAKTYSRSSAQSAVSSFKAAGGGGSRATDSYCVWQDSQGNWKVKHVNLLTICINSIKVTCTDGVCGVD